MTIRLPNYKQSILNVSNSILHYYNIKTPYSGIEKLDTILKKNPNHIIYILLDGLGVNVVKEHLTKDDALYKYMIKQITSVFPPTTVAATNAVISATPPIVNGHIGWVQYFTKEDANVIVFQNKDANDPKRVFKEDLRNKYLHYPRLHERIATANPNITTNEFFPDFRADGSKTFDEQIEKVLLVNHNTDQSFSYIYWTQPDLAEHEYGVASDEVKKIVQELNASFEDLLNNIPTNTTVITIADHGLVDVKQLPYDRTMEFIPYLKRHPSIEPRAMNFFVKQGKNKAFKTFFKKRYKKNYRLYSKQELLRSNLLGKGTPHPILDQILGNYMAIAISDTMLSSKPDSPYKAHHAGLLQEEMIVPLIVYST